MSILDSIANGFKEVVATVENFFSDTKEENKPLEKEQKIDDIEEEEEIDEEEEEIDDDEEIDDEEEINEEEEGSKLSKRISENIKNRGLNIHKSIVLRGKVQSGKSNTMLLEAINLVNKGFSAVIVTLNMTSQVEQLRNRLVGAHGLNRRDITVVNCSSNFELTDEPAIYFSMGNAVQIKKIEKLNNFVLFIDEADAQDTGSSQRAMSLGRLRTDAICTVFVSATPIDCVGRYGVRSRDVISVELKGNYIGFDHKQLHIKETTNSKFTGTKTGDIFKNDKGLKEFINERSMAGPIGSVPQIILVNNCKTIEPYEKVQDWVSVRYPEITTAVYNGKGIRTQDKKYEQTSISSWLQKLKNTGGVEKYPIIIIFAGSMVGRGLSIVSEDFGWEITSMRYIASTTQMKHPNLIQGGGRLCGNKIDMSYPRVLYTNVKKELMIAYSCIEEHMKYFEQMENSEEKCLDGMQNNTFNKNKKIRGSVIMDTKRSCPYKFVPTYRDDEVTIDEILPEEEKCPSNGNDEVKEEAGNIRLINPDKISRNTVEMKVYEDSLEFITETVGTGEWVERSKITKDISKKLAKSEDNIYGVLRALYQTKAVIGVKNDTNGLLMKKVDNKLWMMVN